MAKKFKPIKERLGIVEEFKKFILRGNVVDLAVGVIIGGAFNKIVTSLVNDVIMPMLSLIIGQESLNARFIALDGVHYESAEAAGSAPLLKYGSFLATILDFLLMGVVIFMLVKILNMLSTKIKEKSTHPTTEAAPTEKECPYCISKINIKATICPFCASNLEISTG